MNEDEFDFLEQMALDNYMEEINYLKYLLSPLPFNELPTLSDFLGD